MPDAQVDYRPIPDHRVKAAEYRTYRIVGKGLVLLMLVISTPLVFGMNQSNGYAMWWLLAVPALLAVGLFWRGFPAFCRCPGCKKRMACRSRAGKTTRSQGRFHDIQTQYTRHYLVCDQCQLYLFLGESGDGE